MGAIRITDVTAGVRIAAPELMPLRPSLDMWIELIRRYARSQDDAAYWYCETANAGLLASAACAAGHLGLAEYVADKTNGQGRADIYITHARRRSDFALVLEAKQVFPEGGYRPSVGETLEWAASDARHSDRSVRFRAGVAFATVKLAPTLTPADTAAAVRAFLHDCHALAPDAMAWVFPHIHDPKVAPERSRAGRSFQWPGIAALFRIATAPAG